jgi:hypothetical protein
MVKPKYPHMREWEEQIMTKFHEMIRFTGTYTYDVHLRVRDPPQKLSLTENERLLWRQMTAKRIDTVIETHDRIYVCEVKDRNRPSAIGQALTYKILYEEQYHPTKPVTPAIITQYNDPDMQHVCDKLGIRVWEVP